MKIRHVASSVAALALVTALAACGGTSSAGTSPTASASGASVTVYSADGLAAWYTPMFQQFTQQTGIKVNYVEAGSSEVVGRVEKEKANPQADVLVTLPPFIQQAAADGMLDPIGVDTSAIPAADKDPNGHYTALVNNYSCFIVNNTVSPKPATWDDLLSPSYKGKLQYSTPGQAGDGTALLILLEHEMGTTNALDYLKKLQANNVGPSSSTGALQPKVSSGSLSVANGDVQMNLSSIAQDKSNFSVIFPANGTATPEMVALPYDAGLVKNAPHAAAGKQLLTFLLSAEAQQQVTTLAFGIPVRSDVTPSGDSYTQLQAAIKGKDVYHPDWDAVLTSLDSMVAAYNNAVGA